MERVKNSPTKRLNLVRELKEKLKEKGIKVWDSQIRPAKQQDALKDDYLERVLLLISDRLSSLDEIMDKAVYFFRDPILSSSIMNELTETNIKENISIIETFKKSLLLMEGKKDQGIDGENCHNSSFKNHENVNRETNENEKNPPLSTCNYASIIDNLKSLHDGIKDGDNPSRLPSLIRMIVTGEKVSIMAFVWDILLIFCILFPFHSIQFVLFITFIRLELH